MPVGWAGYVVLKRGLLQKYSNREHRSIKMYVSHRVLCCYILFCNSGLLQKYSNLKHRSITMYVSHPVFRLLYFVRDVVTNIERFYQFAF